MGACAWCMLQVVMPACAALHTQPKQSLLCQEPPIIYCCIAGQVQAGCGRQATIQEHSLLCACVSQPPDAALQEKFKLELPEYPGTACCVRIGGSADTAAGTSNRGSGQNGSSDVAAMRQNYDRGGLADKDALPDPMQMFDR